MVSARTRAVSPRYSGKPFPYNYVDRAVAPDIKNQHVQMSSDHCRCCRYEITLSQHLLFPIILFIGCLLIAKEYQPVDLTATGPTPPRNATPPRATPPGLPEDEPSPAEALNGASLASTFDERFCCHALCMYDMFRII